MIKELAGIKVGQTFASRVNGTQVTITAVMGPYLVYRDKHGCYFNKTPAAFAKQYK